MNDLSMNDFMKFQTEIYPRIWQSAYDAGADARMQGLPRTCNLKGSPFGTPSGNILKVYLSAWEQGWDGYKIPEEFKQIEAVLNSMPLRQCTEDDLL